jgi:hypothetical protein
MKKLSYWLLAWGTVVVTILLLSWPLWQQDRASVVSNSAPVALPPKSGSESAAQPPTAALGVTLKIRKSPVSFYDNIHKYQDDLFDVLQDPHKWMGRARSGDTNASIAVFYALSNCYGAGPSPKVVSQASTAAIERPERMSAEQCKDLPNFSGSDRLDWLELGASRGDGKSAFLYAINAKPQLQLDDDLRTGPQYVKDAIEQKARRYLEVAANVGIREAFLANYESLMYGTYGVFDPIKAHAYVQCLAEIDSSFQLPRAVQVNFLELTTAQTVQIKELASRLCASMSR